MLEHATPRVNSVSRLRVVYLFIYTACIDRSLEGNNALHNRIESRVLLVILMHGGQFELAVSRSGGIL